jgi:hypothetical protein
MKTETLTRALTAVRRLIVVADRNASDWRGMRERRRRQEAAFLRGIVRIEGSQRKAAVVLGVNQSMISRTIDREGHKKERETVKKLRATRDATKPNVASLATAPVKDNVVPLRKRRPDWQPRKPRFKEIEKWVNQYLCWTYTEQATARQILFNLSKGALPNEAYYPEPGLSDSDRAVGQRAGTKRR